MSTETRNDGTQWENPHIGMWYKINVVPSNTPIVIKSSITVGVLDKYRDDTSSAGYERKAGHDSIDIYTAWW